MSIQLRPPQPRDIECYFEIFSDDLHHFIIDEGRCDFEQSKAKLAKLIEINGVLKRVYTVTVEQRPVGFVVVHLNGSDAPFISYAIRRSEWRRGFAALALSRLMEIEKQNLAGFQAATHLNNEASQKLLLKSGFEKLGTKQLKMGERVLFKYSFPMK